MRKMCQWVAFLAIYFLYLTIDVACVDAPDGEFEKMVTWSSPKNGVRFGAMQATPSSRVLIYAWREGTNSVRWACLGMEGKNLDLRLRRLKTVTAGGVAAKTDETEWLTSVGASPVFQRWGPARRKYQSIPLARYATQIGGFDVVDIFGLKESGGYELALWLTLYERVAGEKYVPVGMPPVILKLNLGESGRSH